MNTTQISNRPIETIKSEALNIVFNLSDSLIKDPQDEKIAEHANKVRSVFPSLEQGLRQVGCRDADPIAALIRQGCIWGSDKTIVLSTWFAILLQK